MKNKNICILLLAAMSALGVSAQKGYHNIKIFPDSVIGLNAREYLLQKPLGNPEFPADQGWNDRIFVGLSGGIEGIGDDFVNPHIKAGFRFSGEAGYWLTPLHGVRLGLDGGSHSVHRGFSSSSFFGVRAEYLLNMTTLLRGYNPGRKFELIGGAGLFVERLRGDNSGHSYGVTASMQCRFNVQPSLYLFVEPRLNMLAGKRYDAPYDWRRYNITANLNLGLGYRILTGEQRRLMSVPFVQSNEDNLYFGAGLGLSDMTQENFPQTFFKNLTPHGVAFAGKMFSSISGVEVSMDFGQVEMLRPKGENRYFATGTLSYVLNLNNAMSGYRPDERFQIYLNAGPSLGVAQSHVQLGISAGLTAVYAITPNWGIFLRPQAGVYAREFATDLGHNKQGLLTSASLGIRYTIGDFTRLHNYNFEEFKANDNRFLQAALGLTGRLRFGSGIGEVINLAFVKRFTPISSWRLGLDISAYPRYPHIFAALVQADYLTSITTTMCGYDLKRPFDLQGVIGVFAGPAHYDNSISFSYGLKGGLQGIFRLNDKFDLFVEPQFLASYAPAEYDQHKWVPELRLYAGVKYRFGGRGQRKDKENENKDEHEYKATNDGTRNFASAAGGVAVYAGHIRDNELTATGAINVAAGHWFTSVSGARLAYSHTWINRSQGHCNVGSVHADYMLNINSIINRAEEKKLHFIGIAGAGVAFCPQADAKCGPMGYLGLQVRYNMPYNIDLHVEPGIDIWANRVVPAPLAATSGHNFVMNGRVVVGASYRF